MRGFPLLFFNYYRVYWWVLVRPSSSSSSAHINSTAAFGSDPYPHSDSPIRVSKFPIFRQIDRIAKAIRWRKATAAQSKPSTHPPPIITRRNFNNWSLKIKRIRSLLHSIFVSCICFVLILREPVWLPRNVWEKKRKENWNPRFDFVRLNCILQKWIYVIELIWQPIFV